MFITLITFIFTSLPKDRIYIANNLDLVGVYRSDYKQMSVSSMRSNRFIRSGWERLNGIEPGEALSFKDSTYIKCDVSGCRTILSGTKISYLSSPYYFDAECKWADILIQDFYGRRDCKGAVLLDRFTQKRKGASMIKFSNQGYGIYSDNEHRGQRPWVLQTQ